MEIETTHQATARCATPVHWPATAYPPPFWRLLRLWHEGRSWIRINTQGHMAAYHREQVTASKTASGIRRVPVVASLVAARGWRHRARTKIEEAEVPPSIPPAP